jgi:ferric-dicitrate binding protein FerR (iron transport regulator)
MARHETEALWALASGELGPEAQARVSEHVAGCEDCARKLEEVRRAWSLLRTVRDDVPQVRWAEVDERIQSAAARRLARLERRPLWPWALATVGALAAVLLFVVLRPAAPVSEPSAPVAVREELPTPVKPESREEPAPAPMAPQAPVIATRVESASGAWIREQGTPERSLTAGAQLRSGASVRTRAKSNALLRLPDASRVRVSPDSEVTLARTEAQDVHLTVTRGRVAVQASHAARKGFTVEASGVRASVVGTVFSVECTEHGAVVAVLEGKVRVESEGQAPRFVTAGERLEVKSGQRAPKARALSAQDRRAFQELGLPSVETVSPPRPPSTPAPEPSPAVAVTAPAVEAVPGTTQEEVPSPVAAAPSPSAEGSGAEFAPYPASTSPGPGEPGALAAAESPWAPPDPGGLVPGTADARFLWHAREQLSATTCESFLVGLEEIAERSKVREFREQARYLRARCFEERLAAAEAAAEYQRYLREFPKGRYVREAKAALLP